MLEAVWDEVASGGVASRSLKLRYLLVVGGPGSEFNILVTARINGQIVDQMRVLIYLARL